MTVVGQVLNLAAFLAALVAGGCAEPPPDDLVVARERMVRDQLAGRDVRDRRVLEVMGRVPRNEFVPDDLRSSAYQDRPLPIRRGQTISQPYIVARMTELLRPARDFRVLEVGTGSGYQAAVLAELVKEVDTIELEPDLARQAEARLKRLGYKNVVVRAGDGYQGWPEKAPFDAIIVTCGARHVPPPLFDQLRTGGTMVIPVGDRPGEQWLKVVTKTADGKKKEQDILPVAFVPLRRPAGQKPE